MAKKPFPFKVCEECCSTGGGGGTSGGDVDLSNYLSKDNEEKYTPTSDYNPATKGYVDGEVTKISTLVGKNEFDIKNLTSELHDNYYDKNAVNGSIAEVNEAIAEIDVTSGEGGVSSDTVTVNVGTTRINTYDLTNVMSVNIPVTSIDTKIIINSSVSVNMAFVLLENGTTANLTPNSSAFEIDLANYSGAYQVSVVPTGATIESWSLTATIISYKPCVFAYLKYDSVNRNHLSLGLKDSLVMKTDYPTKDVAGVVKIDRAKQGLLVTDDGELRVYCAEQSEMRAPQNSTKPLSVRNLGLGITINTHQQMNDDYEPSDLVVSGYTVGIQEQLPASYTAVKGYVDSSISALIEKLKAAGVNID